MLDKTGKKGTFIQGMRVTDDETLYVVEAVLGELNQEIVGLINQAGGKAVGLNGQDGGFIRAKKMMVESETEKGKMLDIGFVGDIYNIDPTLIHHLDAADFIPVVAPIGVGEDGQAYNINADLVASELAQTLKAEKLVLMTNTPGVLDKGGKLLTGLTYREINALFDDGTISGGMKPKIQARAGCRAAWALKPRTSLTVASSTHCCCWNSHLGRGRHDDSGRVVLRP